jgi:hypothetical protein
LQPTTANDKVMKKSVERIIADTFFIDMSPPFIDFNADAGLQMHNRHRQIKYALFLPCQYKFIII